MVERHSKVWKSLKSLVGLFVIFGVAWLPSRAGATTRIGNSEIQLVYEMQQTFQANGSRSIEWVQWRNEIRVEYSYEDLIEDHKLFGQYNVPFIETAAFSLTYRGRMDPVYELRDKYTKLYNSDQQRHFEFPENDIREINLDNDYGEVFGHKLSSRIGRQQIVWGESDLFRSIDIVNPLRIDQSGFVGEAFEDFRTPIWAAKFLYDIGNVGSYLSNIGVEAFYTPRWRPGTNHLILEGGWDLQYRNPEEYTPAPGDDGNFINRLGNYKKWGRVRNPWSLFRVGPNARREAPDYGCNNLRCDPTIDNDRGNFIYGIKGSQHQIRGTKWENSMVGTRIIGKAFDNFDFSFNYLFKRADAAAEVYWSDGFDKNKPGSGAVSPALPIFLTPSAGGSQDQVNQWFDLCMNQNKPAYLVGGDVYGYNAQANAAEAQGLKPRYGRRNGTFCLPVGHYYPWTHVIGFTATYNDFDYTGAVFRLEQSWSTNEPRNFSVRNSPKLLQINHEGQDEFGQPCQGGAITCPSTKAFSQKSKSGSAVWRSMIGFDLLRIWSFLPGFLGKDQMFLTGQQLITYTNDNRPTALNPFTNAPYDRLQRWEQLYTLSGSGFFLKGKLEPLWAFAYSVNAQQPLWLLQGFWHGLYFNNLDLYAGMAIYMGSKDKVDASFLNYYADRDTYWIRLQYYLL